MHFGTQVYSQESANMLTVISPADWRWIAVVLFFVLFALLVSRFLRFGESGGSRISIASWAFWSVVVIALLGFLTSSAVVNLDGRTGDVNVTSTMFFWPSHYHYELSQLSGADVSQSEASDALRLVFRGGSSLQLTPFNQQAGKGEAAFHINQFLQEHGGSAQP